MQSLQLSTRAFRRQHSGTPESNCIPPKAWVRATRADVQCRTLADRHYNRQKVGSPCFTPPGRVLVFKTPCAKAVWATSWPFAEYVRHAWAGAWINSLFRNEGAGLSSQLIRAAAAATAEHWDAPPLGLITFVDASKVRTKKNPGYCYLMAGFRHVGETKGGLLAFQLSQADIRNLTLDPLLA
jgi:hypothetical protein